MMHQQDDSKEAVKQQFAQHAEKYVASESHAKGGDLVLLAEWLHPHSTWVMLDVATGGGHVAKTLSPYVGHVFATDLTPRMLTRAAEHLRPEHPNIWYVVADAEALPFLDETFDAVTCRIAPHHFPRPEQFVREVARVLKPGGRFLMIDNVAPAGKQLDLFMNKVEKARDESHVRCLSIEEWRGLFTVAGLTERRESLRRKTYDFPVWVARMARDTKQIEAVETLLIDAADEMKQYFAVKIQDGKVISLQVDEWMVLLEK
ncbi:putative methyltransferase YcgJ [compost metagenome]